MAASTHQPRPKLDEHVELVAYDAGWPARAEEEINRLRVVLGRRAREIVHIGSTAVPGLRAKPIIDLQAAVAKATSAQALVPVMAAARYEDLGEAGVSGRHYFRRRDPPFPVNLHAVWDRRLWQQNLVLRDYLRDNPHEADFYGRQKREILAQGGSSLIVYSDAKAPFLKELITKSQHWGMKMREHYPNDSGSPPPNRDPVGTYPLENNAATEAKATEAFYAALTAAIRLGDEARFDVGELEALRREVASSIVADRGTSMVTQIRYYEEPMRTAGLMYLLDEYCDEQGEALDPRARRKLKFEVESWQTELRRLERAGHNVFCLAQGLDEVQTKEELAAWFRRRGIGKDWPLGR